MQPAVEFAIRDLKLNSGHGIATSVTLFLLCLSATFSSLTFGLKYSPNLSFVVFGIIVALGCASGSKHTYTNLRGDIPVYFGIGASSSTLRNLLFFETLVSTAIGVLGGSLIGTLTFYLTISPIQAITAFQFTGLSLFATIIGGGAGTLAQASRLKEKG